MLSYDLSIHRTIVSMNSTIGLCYSLTCIATEDVQDKSSRKNICHQFILYTSLIFKVTIYFMDLICLLGRVKN